MPWGWAMSGEWEIAAFNLETDEKICKPNDTKEIHSEGETIFEVGK